jgi:hypothetical protein
MFKGKPAVFLLFLTEDKNNGHWITVLDNPKNYEVFDSFGTAIDGDRRWLSKEEQLEFNEVAPILSDLLAKGKKPVIHNTTKLQDDNADTCGRWAAARVLNHNTDMNTFVSVMKGQGKPDDTVTRMIYSMLGK